MTHILGLRRPMARGDPAAEPARGCRTSGHEIRGRSRARGLVKRLPKRLLGGLARGLRLGLGVHGLGAQAAFSRQLLAELALARLGHGAGGRLRLLPGQFGMSLLGAQVADGRERLGQRPLGAFARRALAGERRVGNPAATRRARGRGLVGAMAADHGDRHVAVLHEARPVSVTRVPLAAMPLAAMPLAQGGALTQGGTLSHWGTLAGSALALGALAGPLGAVRIGARPVRFGTARRCPVRAVAQTERAAHVGLGEVEI